MRYFIPIMALALFFAFSTQAHAVTRDAQRTKIQKMESVALANLYKARPETRKKIAEAVGYAVFSSADVAAVFFSATYGRGLAHDNRDSRETYMQMASGGVGLGLGAKDFRMIFIFSEPDAFRNFVNTGLDLSGHVDLSAKKGIKGKAHSGAQDVLPGVTVYQMTKSGLIAQAMLKGTRYWRDGDLNEHEYVSDTRSTSTYNP